MKCDPLMNPCDKCDKCEQHDQAMHDDFVDELIDMFNDDDLTLVRIPSDE